MLSFVTRQSLSALILAGLILGVGLGLFLGESAAVFSVIGEAFIGLLQMTVLPYITVTLIANIGRLVPGEAKRFGAYAGAFLAISLAVTLVAVVLLPMALPERVAGSFFSSSILEERLQTNLLDLFIPANPFHSLANNVVPAVVLFCIAIGLAMMTHPKKSPALAHLDFAASILGRVNHYLVKLTPIGIFAIAASFAGTMQIEEFARLKAYLVLYTVTTALVGFGFLLPLLAAVTPFSYRELFKAVRAPVMTAFVTGKVFVVLPMLVDAAEQLFAKANPNRADGSSSYSKAVVPLAYSFPHAGKLLALLFIPFTAWFVDQPLGREAYPGFLSAGLFSLFGSPLVAMPFLLNLLELPADMFQLFLVSGVVTSRIGDALGAIHLLFVSVLTASALNGGLRFPIRKALVSLGGVLVLGVVTIGVTRVILSRDMGAEYHRDRVIETMHSSVHKIPALVHSSVPPLPDNPLEPALQRIRSTGILRAGYFPDALPNSFFNAEGELVGFDIDMAYLFAGQLGVELEFVPSARLTFTDQLERGDFDLLLSGVPMVPMHLERVRFGGPYMNMTAALLVPDHRRDEFRQRVENGDFQGVKIGTPIKDDNRSFGSGLIPGATHVPLPGWRQYLESDNPVADAIVCSAEGGSAWTLLYPKFSVVPFRPLFQVPVGYPVAKRDEEFADFVTQWLAVTAAGPLDEQLYDHWIEGKPSEQRQPRWSVIRDVLHWVE